MSITIKEFADYQCEWIGILEGSGRTREQAIEWLRIKSKKPRVRVKMGRQRLDVHGRKLFDPYMVRFPWKIEVIAVEIGSLR